MPCGKTLWPKYYTLMCIGKRETGQGAGGSDMSRAKIGVLVSQLAGTFLFGVHLGIGRSHHLVKGLAGVKLLDPDAETQGKAGKRRILGPFSGTVPEA